MKSSEFSAYAILARTLIDKCNWACDVDELRIKLRNWAQTVRGKDKDRKVIERQEDKIRLLAVAPTFLPCQLTLCADIVIVV